MGGSQVTEPRDCECPEYLIPIAVAVAGGCTPCVEVMVARALAGGLPPRDIDTVLRIVVGMRESRCFAAVVGAETIARMEEPLAAVRRALDKAGERA